MDREDFNEFVLKTYASRYGKPHATHKVKIELEYIGRCWLKANGYRIDHCAKVSFWKTPGTIDQMARKGYVRLYCATPTSHHRFQESEVWCLKE